LLAAEPVVSKEANRGGYLAVGVAPLGRLFDIDASWETAHNRHCTGRPVDVSGKGWNNKRTGSVQYLTDTQVDRLEDIAQSQPHMHGIREATIHFELVPLVRVDPCKP
jgi:hypothetical protein